MFFEEERVEIEKVVEELTWVNIIDDSTTLMDETKADIFQPASREAFKSASNLTMDKMSHNRVTIFATDTPTTTTSPATTFSKGEAITVTSWLVALTFYAFY